MTEFSPTSNVSGGVNLSSPALSISSTVPWTKLYTPPSRCQSWSIFGNKTSLSPVNYINPRHFATKNNPRSFLVSTTVNHLNKVFRSE